MTGFRDALLQDKLKEIGAKLGSGVSSKTFAVLVKDSGSEYGSEYGSSKVTDAINLNIPVMTLSEFRGKYL